MLVVITFVRDRCLGLEENTPIGREWGSVEHCYPHHPWDVFSWPQYSLEDCTYMNAI
jgi:hypothetical protein